MPRIEPGILFPSFKHKDIVSKKIVSNDTIKGKYCFIDVWATTCGPCRGEIPYIRKAYEKLNGKMEFLSISLDREKKDLLKYMDENKMLWSNIFLKKGFSDDLAIRLGIWGIPTAYLVGPDGKVITMSGLRGERLLETLEAEFNPEKVSTTETSAHEHKR